MKSGYCDAIALATERLAACRPNKVCTRSGAQYRDGVYLVPWFGVPTPLDSGNDAERILKLHYLIAEGTRPPCGQWIAYREVPDGLFYASKFMARAIRPLVKCFGGQPQTLLKAGAALGGVTADAGDAAVTLSILPHLPVTYMVWAGDDELPAEGNVLFDRTAIGWLPAEDLAVLASVGSYALIAAHRAQHA